jgi:hypothetical protein
MERDVCRELQLESLVNTIVSALASKGYLVYVLDERGDLVPVVSEKGGSREN